MNILIITQGDDPHVNSVAKAIRSKGGTPVIFERYRRDHFVCYSYKNSDCSLTLSTGDKKYNLKNDIHSVWWRVKPITTSEFPSGGNNESEAMCMNEWKHAAHALEYFLSEAKWINPLPAATRANMKAVQLSLALNCGLNVPSTIITNNHEELSSLFAEDKQVIYKTLSSFFSEKTAIFTTKIDKSNILEDTDSIAIAPGIFQRLIEKSHELRVTVVGNKIFTAKINSQVKPETSLDWRLGDYEEMFTPGSLSADTSKKLLAFHQRSNLVYAAYDFVVDKAGNEMFLECNPSGQWLWLEDKSGLAISEAIADELITV